MSRPGCEDFSGSLMPPKSMYSLVTSRVDEVSTSGIERVEKLEAALFVHRAEPVLIPLVTDTHGTETNGRHVDTSVRSELTMAAKPGGWFGSRSP